MKYTGTVSSNDPHSIRVLARLEQRIKLGQKEQAALIERVVNTVIKDKLVPPKGTHFSAGEGRMLIHYGSPTADSFFIHRHALNQLAAKVGMPMVYINTLEQGREPWRMDLLAHNLNELFHKTEFKDRSGPPRFLHRVVGAELRGFLSRRFNRHLASAPLLRSFLDTCAEMGAQPADAIASDVRLSMKCYLPYIFEPVDGEYVAVGVEWANSDFGAGRLHVSLCLWFANNDRFAVLDHQAHSRVHIGSVIEDADVEMSDETYMKEAEAQALAISDAIRSQLDPKSVERLMDAVTGARKEELPWYRLKGQLGRYLNRKELDELKNCLDSEVIDLPPVGRDSDGKPLANIFWAMNALGRMASKTEDLDRKVELQHAAGALLKMEDEDAA